MRFTCRWAHFVENICGLSWVKREDSTSPLARCARSDMGPSGPADIQRVDLLVAGVAGKDRRAVGCDVDLSPPVIHHTTKIFQTGDVFYLLVGESDALDLWLRASGSEIEILAIRRYHPVHDHAQILRAQICRFLGLDIEGQEIGLLPASGYQRVLVNPEAAHALVGRKNRFSPVRTS